MPTKGSHQSRVGSHAASASCAPTEPYILLFSIRRAPQVIKKAPCFITQNPNTLSLVTVKVKRAPDSISGVGKCVEDLTPEYTIMLQKSPMISQKSLIFYHIRALFLIPGVDKGVQNLAPE